ncbi:hypothetical protein BV911_14780 [Pseudoruegeria sp. SK021]|nr:hypothetical protein BV911_14780 [Pseudoruegeria sp. SK021]
MLHSLEILSVARASGFDFLVLDMEHTHVTLEEVAQMSIAGLESGFPIQIRVPHPRSEALTRAVDCGAQTLIVPHVDSVEDALWVADKVRFPPVGRRSIPSPVAVTGFRPVPVGDLTARSEAHLKVTVMIESKEALSAISEIAAVDGIDTLMIGMNDFLASIGHLTAPRHPDVRAAFARVAQAAHAHGKTFAVIGVPEDLIGPYALANGAAEIVVTNEINLLFDASVRCVNNTRSLIAGAGVAHSG